MLYTEKRGAVELTDYVTDDEYTEEYLSTFESWEDIDG